MKRFETTWFYQQIGPFLSETLSFIKDSRTRTLISWWLAASVLMVAINTFTYDLYSLFFSFSHSVYTPFFRYAKLALEVLEKTLGTWLIWYSLKLLFHYYSPTGVVFKALGYSASSLLICLPFLLVKGILGISGEPMNYLILSLISFFFGMVLPVIANNRKPNYYLDRA